MYIAILAAFCISVYSSRLSINLLGVSLGYLLVIQSLIVVSSFIVMHILAMVIISFSRSSKCSRSSLVSSCAHTNSLGSIVVGSFSRSCKFRHWSSKLQSFMRHPCFCEACLSHPFAHPYPVERAFPIVPSNPHHSLVSIKQTASRALLSVRH
jgi:hypothetical protein